MGVSIRKKTKPGPAKGTTIQILPHEVKVFIVKAAARYVRAAEIARQVREEFGLEIAPQVVHRYDCDRPVSETLSPALRDLFHAERREFSEELKQIPGMIRATRVQRLDDLYYAAVTKGDVRAAIAAVEAARKECEKFVIEDDEEPETPTWPAA